MKTENLKITENEIKQNGVQAAADTYPKGNTQNNKSIFDRLPQLIADKFNALLDTMAEMVYSKEEADKQMDSTVAKAVFNTGAADMTKQEYDSDSDGIVNAADNGIVLYRCQDGLHLLTDDGRNLKYGMFKADVTMKTSRMMVNGNGYYVDKSGQDSVYLEKDSVYLFYLEGETINFFEGGAGVLQVMVTDQMPSSPAENTLWVLDTEDAYEVKISAEEPAEPSEGTVWIMTADSGNVPITVQRFPETTIYPFMAYRYKDGRWIKKALMTIKDGVLRTVDKWLVYRGKQNAIYLSDWNVQAAEGNTARVQETEGRLMFRTILDTRDTVTYYNSTKQNLDRMNFLEIKALLSGNNGDGADWPTVTIKLVAPAEEGSDTPFGEVLLSRTEVISSGVKYINPVLNTSELSGGCYLVVEVSGETGAVSLLRIESIEVR